MRSLFISSSIILKILTCSSRQTSSAQFSPPLEENFNECTINKNMFKKKIWGWVNGARWTTQNDNLFSMPPTASLERFNFPSSACLPSLRKVCCRFSTRFPHSEGCVSLQSEFKCLIFCVSRSAFVCTLKGLDSNKWGKKINRRQCMKCSECVCVCVWKTWMQIIVCKECVCVCPTGVGGGRAQLLGSRAWWDWAKGWKRKIKDGERKGERGRPITGPSGTLFSWSQSGGSVRLRHCSLQNIWMFASIFIQRLLQT